MKENKPFRIAGVHINEDAPDLKDADTFEKMQSLDLFSHLEGKEKDKAEADLGKHLGFKKSEAAAQ